VDPEEGSVVVCPILDYVDRIRQSPDGGRQVGPILQLESHVTPVLFISSGQPLDITTGRDDNGDTIFNDRPAGVTRNSERTDGFVQVDLGLSRRFARGATSVTVRGDAFNLFNRTNFSGFFNWGASGVRPDEQGVLAFQPTQAGPSRQFQFTVTIGR